MPEKIKIAILISGLGSNMEALIKDIKKQDHPGEIAIVISDNTDALGLKRAEKLGVPAISLIQDPTAFGKNSFENQLLELLTSNDIQIVCLAGFMKILSSKFLKKFSGEILNIHPSILPSLKGLNTHRRVLEKNLDVHGATVHKVSKDLDGGMILSQTTIAILEKDTPESLSKRLAPKEHQLYTETLRHFLSGNSNIIQKLDLSH